MNKEQKTHEMKRFSDALSLATELHAEQTRKGTDIPYISHLIAVASLVMEAGGNEDEYIAALLHDAVEDQGGTSTLRKITELFGKEVADIVMGCTDDMPEIGQEKRPWMDRKTAYIEHLKTASMSIRLVSNADKLHNARAILSDYNEIGEDIWKRFSQPKDKTLWYYRALADEFARNPASTRLSKELNTVVSILERTSKD
jgi:(p)ppGpp synthase/HD superfamily hydrolase